MAARQHRPTDQGDYFYQSRFRSVRPFWIWAISAANPPSRTAAAITRNRQITQASPIPKAAHCTHQCPGEVIRLTIKRNTRRTGPTKRNLTARHNFHIIIFLSYRGFASLLTQQRNQERGIRKVQSFRSALVGSLKELQLTCPEYVIARNRAPFQLLAYFVTRVSSQYGSHRRARSMNWPPTVWCVCTAKMLRPFRNAFFSASVTPDIS